MSEYTPTLREVRERFIDGFPIDHWAVARADEGQAFDRWLAERDRQVAERAWDDALAHVDQLSDPARTIEIAPDRELITLQDVQQAIGDNPYRGTPEQEGRFSNLSSGHPDYWCHVCNRGLEGCCHEPEQEGKK